MKLPLKQIISQFLSSADLSEHQFMRVWNIAVRGHREFNMDVCGNFKTVLLEVNDDRTVDFPKDLLTFSKVGILNEGGEIVGLTENENMSTLHSQYLAALGQTDVPVLNNSVVFGGSTRIPSVWFNFASDGGYHLYGLRGGTASIGEYKIDEGSRTIYLNHDWPYQSLLMEYLSDGFDCDCDDYMIDVRAEEAMMSYIRWKNAQDLRKKFSTGDVDYYRKEFYNQKRLAKIRLNGVDINQMQKVFRSSITLAAKA
jgi:hypothetical protein